LNENNFLFKRLQVKYKPQIIHRCNWLKFKLNNKQYIVDIVDIIDIYYINYDS
jgi:hypothetical protein